MMDTNAESVNKLKHKLRDLRISHKFLYEQLGGKGEILDYYKQAIREAQEEINVALSSSN